MQPAAAAKVIQDLLCGLRQKNNEHELLDKLRRTVKVSRSHAPRRLTNHCVVWQVVLDQDLTDKEVDEAVRVSCGLSVCFGADPRGLQHIEKVLDGLTGNTTDVPAVAQPPEPPALAVLEPAPVQPLKVPRCSLCGKVLIGHEWSAASQPRGSTSRDQ